MTVLIDQNLVMVTKAQLITLLDDCAFSFAMFLASGTTEGTAVRILFENVNELDLNGSIVKAQLMPLLLTVGAVNQAAVDRVTAYTRQSLGTVV
jgi:hypothetical protein